MSDTLPIHPIGVFDSGVGGLSVWREIRHQLPREDTIYVADQAHVPYGPRTAHEIRVFAHKITRFLIRNGAKTIVVACNTASGAALQTLRRDFPDIRFVGMEPAVKPAAERTATGAIGVIATPTTFQGALFRRLLTRFGERVEIHTQVCPGLVEAVESGALDGPESEALVRDCVEPLFDHNIDQLVLGCTHYPFLLPVIARVVGKHIQLIDPAPAVARQVRRVLEAEALLNEGMDPGCHTFYTTGPISRFRSMVSLLTSLPTPQIRKAEWNHLGIQASAE